MVRYMKVLLLAILPALFFSCDRDRGIIFNGNNGQTYGIIDASINGYNWSANQGSATEFNFALTIYGSAPDGSSLEIVISPYNGVGTYSANSPARITFYDADGSQYNAATGTVTVTADMVDMVQGNFSFSAYSSSQPIDMSGTFSVYFQ